MTMAQSSAFKRFGAVAVVLFAGLAVCGLVLSNRSLHKVRKFLMFVAYSFSSAYVVLHFNEVRLDFGCHVTPP
jgi:hypothetical protein